MGYGIYEKCDPAKKWNNIKCILGYAGASPASEGSSAKKNMGSWNQFQHLMGGLGLSKDGMKELYHESKGLVSDNSESGFEASLKKHGIYEKCNPSEKWAIIKDIF